MQFTNTPSFAPGHTFFEMKRSSGSVTDLNLQGQNSSANWAKQKNEEPAPATANLPLPSYLGKYGMGNSVSPMSNIQRLLPQRRFFDN